MSKKVSQFECFVTESYCYRDMDNRDACKDKFCWVTAESLNDMYEKLGEVKTHETPPEERGDEYTEVEFERIREIIVVSETEVDGERLKTTSACQTQEQQRKDAALKKQLGFAADRQKKEDLEYAEFIRLQAKFSGRA